MAKNQSSRNGASPKRRRCQDNPYHLFVKSGTGGDVHHYIEFLDGSNQMHCLEIEKPLYDLFNRFELNDLTYMNGAERHYERANLSDAELNRRAILPEFSLETMMIGAKNSLPSAGIRVVRTVRAGLHIPLPGASKRTIRSSENTAPEQNEAAGSVWALDACADLRSCITAEQRTDQASS